MTYRLRNIVIAIVLAVLAAFMTALYVANYQERVDQGQQKVNVFVAKTDIAPGTPVSRLTGKVEPREVLRKSLVPAAVYDLADFKGQSTSQWIYSGEQVSARRFSTTGQTGIHAELKGNLRAIQLPGTPQQLLAGILKSGDHVDVVANFKVGNGNVARVLLRDLIVLRSPTSTTPDSKLSSTSSLSVVLQVTDAQAAKLYLVSAGNEGHEWTLELRPPSDATDSPESLATLPHAIRDGLPRNQAGSSLGGNR